MKKIFLFFIAIVLYAGQLYTAPLEGGYALAPPAKATPEEKEAAYREARGLLLAAADKYNRTPYRYGGIDKNGMDCSGLVYVSFRDALGVTVPRDTGGLYTWVEKISFNDVLPGDLLFFVTSGAKISHVGIYTGDKKFIHSASEGPVTGVMYSGLDEKYWSRTFAGAGRVFPAVNGMGNGTNEKKSSSKNNESGSVKTNAQKQNGNGNTLIGFAIAPTWNTYFSDNYIIRGMACQIRVGSEMKPLGIPMIFGAELRPEWDRALGVFRLPLTLSWGKDDKLRIFAGPVLSMGDASLAVSGGSRSYRGGTSWLGAAGITAVPFILKIGECELAPYGELAWQSYFNDSNTKNFGADLAAAIRLSTGLRLTWRK